MPANINTPPPPTRKPTTSSQTPYIIAWFLCLVFYLLQYSTRSAPSVMVSELVSSFGLTTVGLGSLLGLYYYTYSFCSIISGAAVDRWGQNIPSRLGRWCWPWAPACLAGGRMDGKPWPPYAGCGLGFCVCGRGLSGGAGLSQKVSGHGCGGHTVRGHAGWRHGAIYRGMADSWCYQLAFLLD